MTEHKATPEQWAQIEQFVKDCGYDSCLLELRARVESLEAAAKSAEPNHPAEPDSSLVKRVQKAIGHNYPDDARAAIREVAAWLNEENRGFPSWTFLQLQKQLEG